MTSFWTLGELLIFKQILFMVFYFYVYEYFSFKYVCTPYLDLVSTEVTGRYWIHWN